MRPTKPLMLAVLVISLLFMTQRVAATLIVSCPFGSPGGDDLSRGFYVTSYPGSNLYDVHVQYDASPSGTYTISMTARLGAYNGPIVGTPQTVVVSLPSTTSEQDVIFHFGGAPVPSGSTVTFTQKKITGSGTVYYNTGSGTCSGVFETNGTTPPLDTVRRNSVGLGISESSVSTDWAISHVSAIPFNPQPGTPIAFSAVLTALSTTGSYPQSVYVKCTIDGMSCGGGSVAYPGPTGAPAIVNAQVPWIATPGIHTLTWSVSANNDPNPNNNIMSIMFAVGSVQTSQTTQIPTSTQSMPPGFMIEVNPASQSVTQGQTASYSVNVTPLNGFNSQVSLSVSGLPSGANGVFSNPSGTPNFTSTLTVTLTGNVSAGSYTLTVTGSGGGLSQVANLVLTVNAALVTQTSTSPTQTSSDLVSMIQQNQPLILGGIALVIVLAVAVALISRRKPTQPTQATPATTPGMIYCRKCGTQNHTANEFCIKCGNKLH